MQRYNEPPPRSPSPPRRGDLRQPTINSFTPFSRDDDRSQLAQLYTDIRNLIERDTNIMVVQTLVDNLQGHQDIQEMFVGVGQMDFVPGTRRLLDILELIENKTEALDALDDLEAVGMSSTERSVAIAADDSETESEIQSDTDDDEFAIPSVRRQIIFTSDDESDSDVEDLMYILDEPQPDDEDEDSDDESVDRDVLARADTVDVSARLRF